MIELLSFFSFILSFILTLSFDSQNIYIEGRRLSKLAVKGELFYMSFLWMYFKMTKLFFLFHFQMIHSQQQFTPLINRATILQEKLWRTIQFWHFSVSPFGMFPISCFAFQQTRNRNWKLENFISFFWVFFSICGFTNIQIIF